MTVISLVYLKHIQPTYTIIGHKEIKEISYLQNTISKLGIDMYANENHLPCQIFWHSEPNFMPY